jgi:hypothetical protein
MGQNYLEWLVLPHPGRLMLMLLVGFSSNLEGATPPQGPVPHFPQPSEHPGCSLHKLQSESLPVELL